MVTLNTIRALHEHDHSSPAIAHGYRAHDRFDTVAKLHAGAYSPIAYCRICERHATLDLAGLVASDRGHLGIPFRTHCAYCREPGQVTVRPPMATHSHANGWISA